MTDGARDFRAQRSGSIQVRPDVPAPDDAASKPSGGQSPNVIDRVDILSDDSDIELGEGLTDKEACDIIMGELKDLLQQKEDYFID